MKWLVAAPLALSLSVAYAVECGPLVNQDRLMQLESSVRGAGINLIEHSASLQREADGLLRYAPTQATLNYVAGIQRDQSLLADAQAAGGLLEAALNTAWTLASIRDLMMDKRDRVIVEAHLSNSAMFARRLAETQLRYVNQILTKLSRPGVAVDMAGLRDSVGAVFQELANCESPKMPVRDTKAPR